MDVDDAFGVYAEDGEDFSGLASWGSFWGG